MTEETEIISRGVKAAQELEITALAFEELRKGFIAGIMGSNWDDQTGRERLCIALKSLGAIETALQRAVVAGTSAKDLAVASAEMKAALGLKD